MAREQKADVSCRCGRRTAHLTDREVEVLLLLSAGMSNSQIALALGVSTRTVDQHV